jgi:hypothetical protein
LVQLLATEGLGLTLQRHERGFDDLRQRFPADLVQAIGKRHVAQQVAPAALVSQHQSSPLRADELDEDSRSRARGLAEGIEPGKRRARLEAGFQAVWQQKFAQHPLELAPVLGMTDLYDPHAVVLGGSAHSGASGLRPHLARPGESRTAQHEP